MTIFNVIQTSNCDGEILVNVTPCSDLHTAKEVMEEEINTLLTDSKKYKGLDLDKIEKEQESEIGEFLLERNEMSFYIETIYDSYYERIEIEEKHLLTIR